MFGRTFIFICTPLFLGGRRQKAEGRRQKATVYFFPNHPSPITHHQSPITNHQSPITNYLFIVIQFEYVQQ
ncbi:MAG: hypothetical protein ACKPEO_12615 [Sphaerospermopsis kisseleviana]